MKRLHTITLIVLLIAACAPISTTSAPTAADSPVTNATEEPPVSREPMPTDANLSRGNVYIEEMGLIIRESYPPQIALSLSGNLPTPCHQLRSEIDPPDAQNKINVDAYTVVDPNMMCAQVLKPFEENIELGTFPSGHYSVWVNGELAGEFDS